VVADIVGQLGLQTPVLHARAPKHPQGAAVRHAGDLGRCARAEKAAGNGFGRTGTRSTGSLVLKGPSWVDDGARPDTTGLLHDLALRKLTSYPLPARSRRACCCKSPRRIKPRPVVAPDVVSSPVRRVTACHCLLASSDRCKAARIQALLASKPWHTMALIGRAPPVDQHQHHEHREHEPDDPQGHPAGVDQPAGRICSSPRRRIDQADRDDRRHGIPRD